MGKCGKMHIHNRRKCTQRHKDLGLERSLVSVNWLPRSHFGHDAPLGLSKNVQNLIHFIQLIQYTI